jgi:phosphonate transport system substrate-binding protein
MFKGIIFSLLIFSNIIKANGIDNEPLHLTFGLYANEKPSLIVKKFRGVLNQLEIILAKNLNRLVKIKINIAPSYQEAVNDLVSNKVDFSRFGAGSFIKAQIKDPNIKVLAVEAKKGRRFFYGVIATHKNSQIMLMSDLKGKSFAFGDLYSTIGRYLAQYELIKNNVTPDTLSHFKYFERHDSVGVALAHKEFDAGALKNSTYQKLLESGLQLKSILQIKTPTKPWLASSKLDPDTANAIEQVLLTLSPLNIDNNSGFSFLSYDKSAFKHLKNIMQNKRHF